MKITTQEIKHALQLLLAEFESHGASEWEINEDFYWDVPPDARYDSYEKPAELTLGQLSEDVREVRSIAGGDKPSVPLGLVWLSTILRFAGEKGPSGLSAKNPG